MQALHQSTSVRKVTATVIVVGVLALAAVLVYDRGWLLGTQDSQEGEQGIELRENDVNYDESTEEQRQAPTEVSGGSDAEGGGVDAGEIPENTGIGMAITAATVDNAGNLQVRAIIQTLDSNGTCTLVATNGSKRIEKTAKTQAVSNSSTCQGFTISSDEVSSGTWSVRVVYSGNAGTSEASAEVEVR